MIPLDPSKINEIKKLVIKFIKERKLISREENIINAKKAFVAASVLRYCLEEKAKGKINEKHINAYFKALHEFENGTIELLWHEGIIKAKRLGEKTV